MLMQRFRLGVSRSNYSVFVVILAAAFALTWTAQAVENITVTPASVKKSVTPGAAGLGLCYLLDSDINRPRNVSTLQAVTEMGCKVLRFPYGHLADNYLWTIPPYNDAVNGLQPHIASSSQTPGSWNWATSGSGAHKDDMDFDEFMDICANAGSESLVVVNVLSHKYSNGPTYQELKECAVEWVRYAKDNNLDVGYWQIGNEVDHHDDILTLTEYRDQYIDFVTAMKAVDPTIKTGPGILNAATYYNEMLYNPTCLNLIDFISAHEYQWAEYTYAQWRDLPKVVMNSVERVQNKVNGSNKPNLEIHITETSSFPGESGNRENNTMNALLWFELLMDELSTPDVKYTYNWCSRSPWNGENGDGGLANALDNDTNSARKPTGEIIKIVNESLHDQLVDATKASGYVRTYATLSSTNDALTVFLMNRNTSSVDVNVDTVGYAPSSYDRWEFKGSTPTDSAPTYANAGTAVLQTNGFTTTLQPLSLTVMKLEKTAPGVVVDTWLVAGQSNAEGYGITENPVSGLAPSTTLSSIGRNDLDTIHSNVRFYQGSTDFPTVTSSAGMSMAPKDSWHAMTSYEGLAYDWGTGLGAESGRRFGPELAFGFDMQQAVGGEIAIIKYARGGIPISSATSTEQFGVWKDFDPSDGGRTNHYDKMVWTIQDAVDSLPSNTTLNVRGVVWMQGESDASATLAPSYEANLTEFIASLRSDMGAIAASSGGKLTTSAAIWDELDILVGSIQNNSEHSQTVIDAQDAVAAADENVFIVDGTTGLSMLTVDDWSEANIHYDTSGQVELGERFAGKAAQILAAPTPNPLTWASVPAAAGDNQITMTATTATDPSGVEYFFDETSGNTGGDDSGWQDSPTYTDNGLSAATTYSYRVRARDKSANTNETDWTSTELATTLATDNGAPPTPGFDVVPTALSSTEITMTAGTVVDPEGSGVEYYFTETSGKTGGDDSGWRDSPTYTDTGLNPSTTYRYTVMARDKSAQQNPSGTSAALGAKTEDAPSGPAGAIIYEPFNYTPGTLSGGVAVTGTGLTGNWGGSSWSGRAATVAAGSLSYGSLPTSIANKVPYVGTDNATANIATGTLTGLVDDGDTLWFSVLINPNANGSGDTLTSDIRDLGFALSTSNMKESANTPLVSGLGIGFSIEGGNGLAATTWSGGVRNAGFASPPVLNTAAEHGGTYLIVGEMIFGPDDTINIYMPGTDLSLGSVVATRTAALDQSLLNKMTFAGTGGMNCAIDEIRFGVTYEDVIGQEPIVGFVGDVDMELSGSAVDLSWYGVAGQSYGLEVTENLVSGHWDIVTSVAGTNGIISATDALDKTNAFYRVFLGE